MDSIWTQEFSSDCVSERFGKGQLGGGTEVGRKGSGWLGKPSEGDGRVFLMGSVWGPGSQVAADALLHPELVLLPLVATDSLGQAGQTGAVPALASSLGGAGLQPAAS